MSFFEKFAANFQAMLEIFPDAMIGWLGVFVVTGVIIATTWLLDAFTAKRK